MEHIFHLSEEQYAKLALYAARRKQTPEMLFQDWVKAVAHSLEQLPFPNGQLTNQEPSTSPLFQVAGMFAIGELGWADKHDEYS